MNIYSSKYTIKKINFQSELKIFPIHTTDRGPKKELQKINNKKTNNSTLKN